MRDIQGRVMPSDGMIRSSSSIEVDDEEAEIDADNHFYDPEMPEEKFRVDRKKLEQMLLGYNVDVAETAENFFQRIMNETNTIINWPSKLKIGAKSKKDPHIKVSGQYADIKSAKSKIYAVLDMKSNKVTLKMDVAHTDHSHVIGRRGSNIMEVMKNTGCHIHFPDSNRNNPSEKSNQVSIAGQPAFVEIARTRIRGMLPLNFMFEVPVAPGFQPLTDPMSAAIQVIENDYEVKVQFRRSPKTCVTTVVVRGSETNCQRVIEATYMLVEYFTGAFNKGRIQVRTTLEVGPQHHAKVKEQTEAQQIAQKTGTTINFPDVNRFDIHSLNKSTIAISGPVKGVYLARHYLMGCLPLCLLFDLQDNQVLREVPQLMNELSVAITIKPKPKMSTLGVVIRGVEREAAHMYHARRLLLDLEEEEPPILPSGNAFYALASHTSHGSTRTQNFLSMNMDSAHRPILGQHFLKVNTSNSFVHSPVPSPGLSLPFSATNSDSGGHIGGWSHGSYSRCPQIVLNDVVNQSVTYPNYVPAKHYVSYPAAPSSIITALMGSSSRSSLSAPSSTTSSLSSPSESPPRGSPIDTALNQQGYSSETLMELVLRRNGDILQGQNAALDMLTNAFSNINSSVSSQSSFSAGSEISDSETIVPHKDKSWTDSSAETTPQHSSDARDYDTKRILAASAMKLKLDTPEVRVPTSSWSGLGFSHSMSDGALRELKEHERPFEMNMTLACIEFDKDPWKDSNLNDGGGINSGAMTASLLSSDRLSTPDVGVQQQQQRKRGAEVSLGSSNYIDSASLPKLPSVLMDKSTDLTDLFRTLSLSKYSTLFRHQEIDLDTFVTLSDQDLKDLGITTFGARRKMLLAISSLKQQQPAVFSAAPGAERKLSTTTKKNSSSDSDGSPKATNPSYWR